MSYNVVFEHTLKAGGYAGTRTWTDYGSKSEFVRMNPTADGYRTVIAEGVSQTKAIDLCSLSPEVCILTAAVEELCKTKDGRVDTNQAEFQFYMKKTLINYNRQRRHQNNLSPNHSFSFIQIGDEDTEKNRLLRFIKKTFYNPDGTVGNVEIVIVRIHGELLHIALDRVANALEKT
jgi:hypothetical protein